MLAKLPIVGSPIRMADILYAFSRMNDERASSDFGASISQYTQSKHIHLTNSGISSFYLILKALEDRSGKKEVILPAYTAGSLVVAVKKAGLKPVLCDITLEDFNSDRSALIDAVSSETLAVVSVHMFGIGMADIEKIKERIPKDIPLVEDCAQAMGSAINGKKVGVFGDVSFFSFARGKNLPIYGGGCIATNSKELASGLHTTYHILHTTDDRRDSLSIALKTLAFCVAVNPLIYGVGYPLISRFKDIKPPTDFEVKTLSNFQTGLGLALLKRMEELSSKRYDNGMALINGLKDLEGIILPKISKADKPAFNRLPMVFKDLDKKIKVEKELWEAGVESSRMYLMPLHHMFDLGYKREEFPNACYFAERMLTLPTHPSVSPKEISKMIDVIAGAVK